MTRTAAATTERCFVCGEIVEEPQDQHLEVQPAWRMRLKSGNDLIAHDWCSAKLPQGRSATMTVAVRCRTQRGTGTLTARRCCAGPRR